MISGSVRRGILLLALTAGFAAAQEFPFTLTYVLQTDPSVVVLEDGGTLIFDGTRVGASSQAVLNLTNTGNEPGTVTSISIGGKGFGFGAIPLTPLTLTAKQTLQLVVLFRPTEAGDHAGKVLFTLGGTQVVSVNLDGSGTAPGLVYEVVGDPPTPVSPGGAVTFPDTNVGETSLLELRVSNSGTADGAVGSLLVSGLGFQFSNGPALPQTLAPGASVTFTLAFTPPQAGALTGRLSIDSAIFDLKGVGLGSKLEVSYLAGGTTIVLTPTNNVVVFGPTAVTESRDVTVTAKNTGTVPAVFSNIGADPANGPYSVVDPPSLPVSVPPGSSLNITVTFTPTLLGFVNGALRLDNTVVPLIGSGTAPPALPAYTILGPSGTTTASTQQNVGVTLANPYPVTIAGALSISVAGDLPADQAVQFASGGRTVAFTIPANTTDAVFAGLGKQIGVQTGTVASAVTLTPSFATQAGNINLTPDAPSVLQFSVDRAAPHLIIAQITNQTATSFTLSVTGFTTSRSLTEWRVQFTPAKDVKVPTSEFTVDVSQVAAAWFRSAVSQPFGGQFTVAVPFTFQGSLGTNRSAVSAVSLVSVTMSNELGSSNTVQVNVP